VAVGNTHAMTRVPISSAPTTWRRVPRAHASRAEPDPVRLSVSCTWLDRCSVVLLAGDLDAETSVALASSFEQLVGSGFDEVVLDVSDLCHLDESGAVALAELWAELRNDGIICRVRGLPPVFADSPFELLIHVRNLDPVGCTLEASSPLISPG
jgi:anti-anti-sigma regulatory factor